MRGMTATHLPILLPRPRLLRLTRGSVPAAATFLPEVRVDPSAVPHPQGYHLQISAKGGARITAHDEAGAFYARQTLVQLQRVAELGDGAIPCLHIEDHPDFAKRGIMLDISRDKVPTMPTLRRLVDMMAGLKLNELQLYTEHTFAYWQHREVWADASPMMPDEVRELDRYCRARHIELVANQNSFGHMERWLKHRRYKPLAETTGAIQTPWGTRSQATCLCPVEPRSLDLLAGLYDELLPCFSSGLFNVGCDETWDLGQGRSKAACERDGKGRVYLDFLLQIHKLVSARGKRMQFWGDIILHHRELIAELPRDVIPLAWGYEADHPFEKECGLFAEAGLSFYVCPGTSSWNSLGGRTGNAMGNLLAAAKHGKSGGKSGGGGGYLITDWGDNGHLQPWPVSFLGYAYGAAVSWCLETNEDIDIAAALDTHIFVDEAGAMGKAWCDLGAAHEATGITLRNQSALSTLLLDPACDMTGERWQGGTIESFGKAKKRIGEATLTASKATQRRDDGELINEEIHYAGAMMILACDLAIERLKRKGKLPGKLPQRTRKQFANNLRDILTLHRHTWLCRNRPGGMTDSAARLQKAFQCFTT